MIPLLLTASAVVIVSAICSLCEAVLYSVPPSLVAKLEDEGRPSGLALARLRNSIQEPITAILTLNTVANTAGAAVAGALAAKALSERNVFVFSAALTVAILLFSEIVPKTIGVVHGRIIAPWIARPLELGVWLLKPIIVVINGITRLITPESGPDGISDEELATLARRGGATGALGPTEALVIQNVLALPDTTARAIMTPRTVVFCLQADRNALDAAADQDLMVHSRVPVFDSEPDDIIGIVFRRDLLVADSPTATVRDFVRPVQFVGELEPVDNVLEVLLLHHQHMLIVLGEFGGFAGVLTLEDVLEEILGQEIVDEFDQVADMRELALQRREEALARMRRQT